MRSGPKYGSDYRCFTDDIGGRCDLAQSIILAAITATATILTELEKQLSQANSQNQQQLDHYESTLERVVQQLNEIHSGALGMGTTVKKLVQQMAVTEERQSQLEAEEPETKMYQQAVRLAQQGASVEVIIQDCGLPQGEAELLISLHSK